MTEDAAEQYNRVIRNLGALVHPLDFGCDQNTDMTFRCPSRTDKFPNAFWLSNPNNYYEGNHGVGGFRHGAFFFETRAVVGLVRREYPAEVRKVGYGNGKIKGSVNLLHFKNNVGHSSTIGIGNYPTMWFPDKESSVVEDVVAWRCVRGYVGRGAYKVRRARLVENGAAFVSSAKKLYISESTMVAHPTWASWHGGLKFVSTPLVYKEPVKTNVNNLKELFDIDDYTRNWARCHGHYDIEALNVPGRGDFWSGIFNDPAHLTDCPPE